MRKPKQLYGMFLSIPIARGVLHESERYEAMHMICEATHRQVWRDT